MDLIRIHDFSFNTDFSGRLGICVAIQKTANILIKNNYIGGFLIFLASH